MSMIELTRKLALGASLVVFGATMAMAQEEAPTPTADDLSMGQEVNTPPAPRTQETASVGETYLVTTSDLWEQRCIKTEDGDDPCQVYQLLKDGNGTSVAEFTMFPLPAGAQATAGATIIVPLETLLTANLHLQIDTGAPKIYPYTFCTQIGCIARVGFTAAEVDQLKKGNKAVITLVPAAAPDQKVALDVSLKGFTKGFEALPIPKN